MRVNCSFGKLCRPPPGQPDTCHYCRGLSRWSHNILKRVIVQMKVGESHISPLQILQLKIIIVLGLLPTAASKNIHCTVYVSSQTRALRTSSHKIFLMTMTTHDYISEGPSGKGISLLPFEDSCPSRRKSPCSSAERNYSTPLGLSSTSMYNF